MIEVPIGLFVAGWFAIGFLFGLVMGFYLQIIWNDPNDTTGP